MFRPATFLERYENGEIEPNQVLTSDDRTLLYMGDDSDWGLQLIQELLQRGANPNHRDIYGFTPLYNYDQLGCPEAVDLLLYYGADPTIRANDESLPKILRDPVAPIPRSTWALMSTTPEQRRLFWLVDHRRRRRQAAHLLVEYFDNEIYYDVATLILDYLIFNPSKGQIDA